MVLVLLGIPFVFDNTPVLEAFSYNFLILCRDRIFILGGDLLHPFFVFSCTPILETIFLCLLEL
ncbi:MAG: hypothetical protein QW356_07880, partial [Candidatus Hadarchaeales archaeon]